jgi:putative two-component system response regulator
MLSLETRDVAIFAMAKLAESRDPETGAHLERVQRYARALTQQLRRAGRFAGQIDDEFIRLIYLTSPLHDIGKVGIPDCVLLKPGRLSDHEFEMMKAHTTLGGQTLEAALRKFPNVKFLQMARDIAMTHHERVDGKGYPAGLAGDSIPLAGRIVAVADVYDALTSKRVYKDAFGHEVAKSIIVADAGTHFDPLVVDAFVAAEAEFQAVRQRFSEVTAAAA